MSASDGSSWLCIYLRPWYEYVPSYMYIPYLPLSRYAMDGLDWIGWSLCVPSSRATTVSASISKLSHIIATPNSAAHAEIYIGKTLIRLL